jgi:hypothetical protein
MAAIARRMIPMSIEIINLDALLGVAQSLLVLSRHEQGRPCGMVRLKQQ